MSQASCTIPKSLAALFGATALLLALFATSASATPSPWWQITTDSHPTNLSPGESAV